MSGKPKFVIFAHNATYDKLHQVATLGLTAAASSDPDGDATGPNYGPKFHHSAP